MHCDISQFQNTTFDLLIVGGGINGAAIANLAAQRGLKVTLLEKGDFASGTSSKSTKLLHGGIRYLENFEFDLVHESLHERFIQFKSVPHLAKPIRFIIPVYHGDKRPLWMMKLAVFLYDSLAGCYRIGKHQSLSREELRKLEPHLLNDGLMGAISYYDVQMDDARICLENILTAQQHGARVANYIKVMSFIHTDGKITGAKAVDVLTEKSFDVRAKRIVCTAGPWTNALLRVASPNTKKIVRTTKGIHIVYKGQLTSNALLITSRKDNRIFFIIPWLGNSLIGTTDTNYIGNPDQVKVNQEDIDYLLKEASRVLPSVDFSPENIITTFAGLRPLIRKGGAPSKVSRKHFIMETPSGLIVVIGGKYTTYRKIAEECVNRVIANSEGVKQSLKRLLRRFAPRNDVNVQYSLYGSGPINDDLNQIARDQGLTLDTIEILIKTYGTRFKAVLALTKNQPSLKEPICTCTPFIKAQIVYAIETEMARTAEDIIQRRLSLIYRDCRTKDCERVIADFINKSIST